MKAWTKGCLLHPKNPCPSAFLVSLLLVCANATPLPAEQACAEEKIGPLLDVLRDRDLQKADPTRVETTIREIGQMRCVEAIDDLVAHLTFRSSYGDDKGSLVRLRPVYTGTRYPATSAIAEMGKVALPTLVEVIETNDEDSLRSKNARFTVRAIIKEPAEIDKFFKEAAAKASTPEGRRRLLKALETAETDFRSD